MRYIQEIDPTKKQLLRTKFVNDILPKALNEFEKMLSLNSGKFLIGRTLTYADLGLVNAWEWLDEGIGKQILNEYPLIKNHNTFIRTIPCVNEYFQSLKPLNKIRRVV